MSAKARRSRGKHIVQVKKKKRTYQPVTRSEASVPAEKPAVAPVPPAITPAKISAPAIEYPGLSAELARIALFFAIMLPILIVLALVLD